MPSKLKGQKAYPMLNTTAGFTFYSEYKTADFFNKLSEQLGAIKSFFNEKSAKNVLTAPILLCQLFFILNDAYLQKDSFLL